MAYEWHQHKNAAVAAEALADAVAEKLNTVLVQQEYAVLAVSGGRSPIAFFEALSQKDLDWPRVYITLVDERIVPTDHADSNTALVHQYLLQNKAKAAGWLPLVEAGLKAEALQPEAVVQTALKHYRRRDVLVLGMGGDGHTASLFPQAPQLDQGLDEKNEIPLLHTTPVTAAHERISMTLNAIAETPAVFLAIQGGDKKNIFEQAAVAPSKQFPISYVLNHKKVNCHVHYSD
ncbi:6-phosphogluconolactonase [Neisseria zalophi]|uniref:6-phosphogluconolactonase n=1 Tax=Neisseria zalophi TaxID=640030 RepID=A0A5J6PZC5_9NEIS|nr:6-phosphogluconolactonase [Neisseria zalophi]QEY26533.1 6-phosphogluconolactonase [Neisseria zalophi]